MESNLELKTKALRSIYMDLFIHLLNEEDNTDIEDCNILHKVLSPVRNQGSINACAFVSTIACIEMLYRISKIRIHHSDLYCFDAEDVYDHLFLVKPKLRDAKTYLRTSSAVPQISIPVAEEISESDESNPESLDKEALQSKVTATISMVEHHFTSTDDVPDANPLALILKASEAIPADASMETDVPSASTSQQPSTTAPSFDVLLPLPPVIKLDPQPLDQVQMKIVPSSALMDPEAEDFIDQLDEAGLSSPQIPKGKSVSLLSSGSAFEHETISELAVLSTAVSNLASDIKSLRTDQSISSDDFKDFKDRMLKQLNVITTSVSTNFKIIEQIRVTQKNAAVAFGGELRRTKQKISVEFQQAQLNLSNQMESFQTTVGGQISELMDFLQSQGRDVKKGEVKEKKTEKKTESSRKPSGGSSESKHHDYHRQYPRRHQ